MTLSQIKRLLIVLGVVAGVVFVPWLIGYLVDLILEPNSNMPAGKEVVVVWFIGVMCAAMGALALTVAAALAIISFMGIIFIFRLLIASGEDLFKYIKNG